MSENKSRVTLIVASYNHSEFLFQRISSLIIQDYEDIEIIVIDDASTDESLEVLKQFEHHPKVQLVKLSKNSGWVSVSNLGAELASGEFLIFANCDDYSDPEQVTELVNSMHRNPTAGLAFSRSNIVDTKGELQGNDYETRGRRFKKKCATNTLISKRLMTSYLFHSIVIPNLSAAIFRRSAFMEIGKFSEEVQIAADWEIYFRIAEKYDVAYVARALNFFRSHNESIRSHTQVRLMQEDIARLLLDRLQVTDASLLQKFVYRHRIMYLLILVLRKPIKSNFSDTIYLLKFACTHDPFCLPVLPIAVLSRIGRLPIGMALQIYKRVLE